jgi:hypothetical protein
VKTPGSVQPGIGMIRAMAPEARKNRSWVWAWEPAGQAIGHTPAEMFLASGLHEFGDLLQMKMNTIDDCINGDFFYAG